MALIAPQDSVLSQRLAEELADVECRFTVELESDLACVKALVRHIERYRGKRLRPMLVLVSGMATATKPNELTDAHRVVATVVEMVHMATLVHDDILDEAEVRRRGATINHLQGNETAVMLGDYLISHAYHLCSSIGDAKISREIAQATNIVCEGELLQLTNRENLELDEGTYFEIIRRKTASLCGVCCSLGASLSGADKSVADDMYRYGELLGQAFQIVDDLLDLTGDEETVGKTVGLDLQKGKLTLPLIHHLSTLDPDQRVAFRALLRSGAASDDVGAQDVARIVQEVRASGSVEHAATTARAWVDQAKGLLASLPESEARNLLNDMAEAVITREF